MKTKIRLAVLSVVAAAVLSLPALALFYPQLTSFKSQASRFNVAQGKGLERGIYAERPTIGGWLSLQLIKRAGVDRPRSYFYGPYKNLVVDAGETALRDCFIATSCTAVQAWKFHGLGTGATAAAENNTGCQTELTTAYNPDSTRATGSQTNNGANVYRTVGTNTVDGAAAVTEFCLMTAATGAGTPMWSRVVFTVINLASSDSLQTTYDLTIE